MNQIRNAPKGMLTEAQSRQAAYEVFQMLQEKGFNRSEIIRFSSQLIDCIINSLERQTTPAREVSPLHLESVQ